jgi:molybdenum cofactor synthesis domain-containing protein
VVERLAAVVTISDSVAAGTAEDLSGVVAKRELKRLGFTVSESIVVSDGVGSVSAALVEVSKRVGLVITSGGTGLSPRDLTPEATRSVIDREIPGISEAMRSATFGRIPFGMLSRGIAGLIDACVVVNLPGSPKAVEEGFAVIGEVLIHAVDVASGDFGRHD